MLLLLPINFVCYVQLWAGVDGRLEAGGAANDRRFAASHPHHALSAKVSAPSTCAANKATQQTPGVLPLIAVALLLYQSCMIDVHRCALPLQHQAPPSAHCGGLPTRYGLSRPTMLVKLLSAAAARSRPRTAFARYALRRKYAAAVCTNTKHTHSTPPSLCTCCSLVTSNARANSATPGPRRLHPNSPKLSSLTPATAVMRLLVACSLPYGLFAPPMPVTAPPLPHPYLHAECSFLSAPPGRPSLLRSRLPNAVLARNARHVRLLRGLAPESSPLPPGPPLPPALPSPHPSCSSSSTSSPDSPMPLHTHTTGGR